MLAQDAVAPASSPLRCRSERGRHAATCRCASSPTAAPSRRWRTISFSVERGEFLSLLGPVGLRQVHAAAHRRRPGRADRRAGLACSACTPQEARQKRALGFVFQDAALLPWRTALQNVELPLEVGGFARLPSGAPTPRELLELVGLEGWEKALPARALGRHAPARVDRARAAQRSADPADGRAVRRARRDHARPAERGAAPHLAGNRHHHPVRHPLHLRGDVPRPARAGDGGQSRPRARDRAGRSAARPRPLDPRDRAVHPHRRASARACWSGACNDRVRPSRPMSALDIAADRSAPIIARASASCGAGACCRPSASARRCCIWAASSSGSKCRRSSRRRRCSSSQTLYAKCDVLMLNLLPTAIEAICGFLLGNLDGDPASRRCSCTTRRWRKLLPGRA